jgi:hypothetical protein
MKNPAILPVFSGGSVVRLRVDRYDNDDYCNLSLTL